MALGLSGLVAGSLVASGIELGWVTPSERHHVALTLLAFPFLLQLTASVFAFLARDTAVGTAMGVLSGTWLATALVWVTSPPRGHSGSLGLLLLAAAFLLGATAVAAGAGKLVPGIVFMTEAVRFALAGIHELGGAHAWVSAAGIVGLVVVVMAGYTMLAVVLEAALPEPPLPLLRRARGAAAVSEPFPRHAARSEQSPGVREQL